MPQEQKSYRNPQGQPRHRVVVSLGDAPLAAEDWKAVAATVAGQLYGQPPLMPGELSARGQEYVDSITRRVLREGRWLPGTALPDLLGEGILKGDSNRF